MIQGTTPTLYFAFGIDLSTLKEWKVVFAQEDKDNLVKTQDDCLIGENNIIYLKLSQEETLALDYTKLVEIQAKVLTTDNNVFASNLVRTTVGKILDKTQYSAENGEILPIGNEKIIDLTFDTTCGFALEFGDQIVYRESPIDKELNKDSENAIANKAVYEAVKALEKLIAESGGGSVTITIDKEINAESTNPVENQAIAKALDNKLDKKSTAGTSVYSQNNGVQRLISVGYGANAYTLAYRDENGNFQVNAPVKDKDCINNEYFNEGLEVKLDKYTSGGAKRVYGIKRDGSQEKIQIADSVFLGNINNMLPQYFDKTSTQNYGATLSDTKSVLLTNEPNQPYQCANQKYVDEKIAEVGGGEWQTLTLTPFSTNILTATIESDTQIKNIEIRGYFSINDIADQNMPVPIMVNGIMPLDRPCKMLTESSITFTISQLGNTSYSFSIAETNSANKFYEGWTAIQYRIINI